MFGHTTAEVKCRPSSSNISHLQLDLKRHSLTLSATLKFYDHGMPLTCEPYDGVVANAVSAVCPTNGDAPTDA